MRTTITAFLAALILPGLSMAAADEAKTITATHTLGTVELPVNPKRVAVLDYGSLETISELGVTPALALPKKFLPPYLSKFSGEQYTDLGTVKEFNIETINAFKPDLIIISGRQQDYYQKLSSIAPVYLVDILAKEQLGESALAPGPFSSVAREQSHVNLPRRRVPSGSSIHLPGTPFTGPVMLCWRLYSAIISSSRMASSSPVP